MRQKSLERIVDIVVPTFDAREMVLACVERLVSEPAVAGVVVIDDASSDGTADALAERYPEVELVPLTAHRGLAHALNRGAAVGSAELVLFLNNDVLARPGAVTLLAEALRADPDAVSAGGRLVDPGTTRTQVSYQPRPVPQLGGLLVRISGVERVWPRNPWTGAHLTAPLLETGSQRTDRQPAGACLIVRRTIFEQEEGWDERYWMWYEDVDISRRLLAHGPALYVPGAVFEHLGAASTRTWRKYEQHLRLYHGALVYAQRHLSPLGQAVLGAVTAATCLTRMLAHSLRRDQTALASYWSLLRAAVDACRFKPVRWPPVGLDRPGVTS